MDVPVRCLSHLQKSTGGLGSEKPFPQNVVSRKRDGGRGGRGPGQRMYQSSKVASAVPGGARFSDEALRCEAVRGEGSRGRRKTEHRKAGCATPRSPARETRKGSSGTAEEPSQGKSAVNRMRNPRSRER